MPNVEIEEYVDRVEVTRNGDIQWRKVKVLVDDTGRTLNKSFIDRQVVSPGEIDAGKHSEIPEIVRAIAEIEHTPERIEKRRVNVLIPRKLQEVEVQKNLYNRRVREAAEASIEDKDAAETAVGKQAIAVDAAEAALTALVGDDAGIMMNDYHNVLTRGGTLTIGDT